MNYVKKLDLHWFCTQNHILEPFSVRRACTKSYVTSEPYPRASQIWCQNVRETWKKKVIKYHGESFARCRVIARNVKGGLLGPPSLFRVNPNQTVSCNNFAELFFCAPRFRDFFTFESCANFDAIFVKSGIPFRSYGTLCNRASTQNMGIFWICVQNIWKMAFCAKNPFWALKVCYLPWF